VGPAGHTQPLMMDKHMLHVASRSNTSTPFYVHLHLVGSSLPVHASAVLVKIRSMSDARGICAAIIATPVVCCTGNLTKRVANIRIRVTNTLY